GAPASDARAPRAAVPLVVAQAIEEGGPAAGSPRTFTVLAGRNTAPAANADAPVAPRPVSRRRPGWRANGDAHDHGDGDYRTSTQPASFENRPHPGSLAGAPQPDNQQLR